MKVPLLKLLTLLLGWILAAAPCRSDEKIKVGVSLPLTGFSSAYGTDLLNFLLFAAEDLAPGKYELIVEDDQCSGKGAATVAQKLISRDRVKYVLGFGCSGALLASAKIYNQNKVIVIGTGVAAPAISSAGDYIYRTWLSDARAAALLAEYIAARHRAVGLMTEETEYNLDFQKVLEEHGSALRLGLTSRNFLTTETDLGSTLLQLRLAKIQALFINAQSETTFLNVLKQARALGLPAAVYGVYPPGSAKFRAAAGSLANGIVYADLPELDNLLNAEGRLTYQRFLKRFRRVNTWPAMFVSSYEAFRALNQAVLSAGDVQQYFDTAKFNGVFGDWTFDRNGDLQGLHFVLKEIDGGQIRTINKLPPPKVHD